LPLQEQNMNQQLLTANINPIIIGYMKKNKIS